MSVLLSKDMDFGNNVTLKTKFSTLIVTYVFIHYVHYAGRLHMKKYLLNYSSLLSLSAY